MEMSAQAEEGKWAHLQSTDERRIAQQSTTECQLFQPHEGESVPFLPAEQPERAASRQHGRVGLAGVFAESECGGKFAGS